MASPKINTILSFATKGVGGVNNDVKSVVSGVNGATSAVGKLTSKISSIQKGVAFQSVVAAAGAVKDAFNAVTDTISSAVSTVYNLAASQAAAADQIGKTSALMGMQVGELQALRSAGQHAGMSIDGVDSALEKFSINTGKAAAGEKAQIDLFNALGVATKNADGSLRNQTDLLMDVADAYSKLTDSQDRNRVSLALFGRSAVQMSALLKDGSAGIRDAVAQYELTGAGYTEQQTKQAAEFNDKLQTMHEYIAGVKNQLFFALVPAFSKLFDGVSSFVEKNRPKINSIVSSLSDKLPSIIQDITDALPAILSGVSMIASAVSAVVDFTGPWIPLLSAAGVLIGGTILVAIGAVGVAVSAVGAAFGGAIAAAAPILGIVALAATGIVAWGIAIKSVYDNFDMLKSFVVDDVFGAFVSGVKQFANMFIDVFATIADGIAKIPFIGEKIAGGAGDWWRSQKFDVGSFETPKSPVAEFGASSGKAPAAPVAAAQTTPPVDQVPAGESSASDVTGVAPGTSSNLTVDFKGMPKGASVAPGPGFDFDNFDYSVGYAFGG